MEERGKNLNQEYESLMDKQLNDNLESPKNADIIAYAFNIVFCSISSDFYEELEVMNPKAINEAFWNAFYNNREVLLNSDFSFIKYIHIFNYADEHDVGFVELYLDFVQGLLADTREYMGKSNAIFDSDTLVKFFGNIGFSGSNFIEYCNDADCAVYNPLVYSTILSNRENNKNTYQFGKFFSSHFFWDQLDGKDDLELRGMMEQWLDSFEAKSNNGDPNMTNAFFIRGESGNHQLFGENEQYVLYANVGIDGSKVDKACIKAFLQQFKAFIDSASLNIIVCIKEYQKRQNAVRTSVAQVMARNLAHNYGAHVISNLANDNVYTKLSDAEIKGTLTKYVSNPTVYQDNKNLQLPYLFQYLKDRMDYLSEVTFGISNVLATRSVYGDVFKELDRERILLNYISGVPDFKYKFCLKHDGIGITDENDIAVAFPSDVLGCQAFYNIIENIIRNTAKHASNDVQDVVTFTIEFSDVEGYSEYYCVEIDNGIAEVDFDDLVRKQNQRINTSVLDKENTLRNHSLGLLEMGASAAFLRQVDIAKVDAYEYHFDVNDHGLENQYHNLILLKAINKNGALGYRFFLQKPKEFLFVGAFDVEKSLKDMMAREGALFVGEEEFANAVCEGKSFAQPFLFYLDSVSERTKEFLSDESDSKTLMTTRKMALTQDEVKEIINAIKSNNHCGMLEQLKAFAWNKYFKEKILVDLKHPGLKIRTAFDPFKSQGAFVSNQVVFLNHANKKTHAKQWKQASGDNSSESWIENLSSRTCTKLPLFNKYAVGEVEPTSDYVENIRKVDSVKYEIFEAYHNKVIALDERIQRFSNENYEGSSNDMEGPIPCSELFKSTNVLIPPTPLDPNTFDAASVEIIEQFIEDNLSNAFVLIHYGILERMYKDVAAISKKLDDWAKAAKRVVVTSGRGSHSLTLPPSVCFANLSSVLYAFTDNRNKLLINNMLNQSRRKNG
ncbi:MAG: hypothetical protein K5920_06625 [Bacteroidales bacterium]|nr:hypothetical protein [Bacteroidales bacterium]